MKPRLLEQPGFFLGCSVSEAQVLVGPHFPIFGLGCPSSPESTCLMIVRLLFGHAFVARRVVALFSSSARIVIRSRSIAATPVANSPASLNTASPIVAINNPKKAASITVTANAPTGGARPWPPLNRPLQKA
jgi:hypothetical protein